MDGRRSVGGKRADPQPFAFIGNGAKRQAPDIDKGLRCLNLKLHQIYEVGPARQCQRIDLSRKLRRVFETLGALVVERPHASAPATSRMAARMLG